MSRHLNYETLLERLSQEASFKFHFRLVIDTVHYYYLLIARNGNADDYRDFVIAVACEDNDVPDQDKKHKDTYPYDLFLSDYIRQRVHPDDRTMLEESLELGNVMGVLSGQSEYKGNYRINDRDGIHYYQFRFIKNEDSGIIVLGFLNVDDVVESEIRHQKLLKEALDTAERANAEKSNFLSRMSHDMRTPLNGIIGLLEIDKKNSLFRPEIKYFRPGREFLSSLIIIPHPYTLSGYALPDILSLFHPAYVQYILPGFYRCQWQPYRPGDTDPAYIHSCPDSASLL